MRHLAAPLIPAFLAVALTAPGAATFSSNDAAIVHVLNRLGFGPRPDDVQRVRKMGLERYLEQQLYPERIPDSILQGRLAGLKTLTMSSPELLQQYEQPAREARRAQQRQQGNQDPAMRSSQPPPNRQQQQAANLPFLEMSEQKVLRAVYGERQLEEVLTDFWFNHFNVDARKGPVRFLLTEYERDAIRPHVFGTFRDLLGATAKSPAMLFYLDNWMSADPNANAGAQTQRRGRTQGPNRIDPLRPRRPERPVAPPQPNSVRRGLNENYARELMELHTLGVDGGYTQKDVTEVARAFTGWTIDNPRQSGTFRFEPRMHDNGEKIVLDHRITAGGINDGEQILDLLAAHPSTARFISTKLARRFVGDTPPAALVDRLAARFTQTNGDLREVMRTLLTSPEFLSPDAYSARVKTPFEFVVSAVRATGATLPNARPIVQSLQQLGMPLYQCQPPTGYKDTADAWVNTGALINRMNFAVTLANAPGLKTGPPADLLVGLKLSDATRTTIEKAPSASQALALTLGSPEFQRR